MRGTKKTGRMESPIRQTEKRYGSRAMTAAIFMGFFFILAGHKAVGKGLILGTIFSVINFVLMGETLHIRMGESRKKTFFLSLSSISFRYLLLAIPLFVAIKYEQFNLIAAVVGIFSIQLVILSEHFLIFIRSARGKHKKKG